MTTKYRFPDSIWTTAQQQDGVFSHKQVAALGITRNIIQRALDDHIWWQVTRGLYSFSPTPSWAGLAWGGILLAGDDAVLGHETAGHLYGWCDPPSTIDVLAPRRIRSRGCWRFHNTRTQARGTLPRTSPEETALAMAGTRGAGSALGVLADAVASGRTTAPRLLEAAERVPNLPHRRMVLDVLGDVAAGVMSHLEERFRTFVEAAHDLPTPIRQKRLAGKTFIDVVFEDYNLVVELDGRLGHTGQGAFRDHRRDNRNAKAGWITLRYGWHDVVTRPCEVLAEIVEVLWQQGWRGRPRRCANCGPQRAVAA